MPVRDPAGELDTQALLCTDQSVNRVQILQRLVLRWQLEVTPYQVRGGLYQEVRAHLGVETQRQWSGHAIGRTTPILMGRFSRIALELTRYSKKAPSSKARRAGTPNPPHFRGCHCPGAPTPVAGIGEFSSSAPDDDRGKPVPDLHSRIIDSLAYAA